MSKSPNNPPKDGILTPQKGSNSKNVIPNSTNIIHAPSQDNFENPI